MHCAAYFKVNNHSNEGEKAETGNIYESSCVFFSVAMILLCGLRHSPFADNEWRKVALSSDTLNAKPLLCS